MEPAKGAPRSVAVPDPSTATMCTSVPPGSPWNTLESITATPPGLRREAIRPDRHDAWRTRTRPPSPWEGCAPVRRRRRPSNRCCPLASLRRSVRRPSTSRPRGRRRDGKRPGCELHPLTPDPREQYFPFHCCTSPMHATRATASATRRRRSRRPASAQPAATPSCCLPACLRSCNIVRSVATSPTVRSVSLRCVQVVGPEKESWTTPSHLADRHPNESGGTVHGAGAFRIGQGPRVGPAPQDAPS